MERFTISLPDELAKQFDTLIAERGYANRSEAVRDLIRARLGNASLGGSKSRGKDPRWCVANVSYVYDHHDQTVAARVLDLQHDHHDLVITSVHTHLDHRDCMETVVLRGPLAPVTACAERLTALRGVRHGNMHIVPLDVNGPGHRHDHASALPHKHLKPLN